MSKHSFGSQSPWLSYFVSVTNSRAVQKVKQRCSSLGHLCFLGMETSVLAEEAAEIVL